MPDFRGMVQKFRDNGYSDFEISQILLRSPQTRPFIDKMREEGYGDKETLRHLGLEYADPDKATYGPAQSAAQGATLNAGVPIMAATQALKQGLTEGGPRETISPTWPFSKLPGAGDVELPIAKGTFSGPNSTYSQAHDQYSLAKKDYEAEHPVESAVTEIGGSLLPLAGVGGLVTRGAAMLPGVAGRIASGTAGYDAAGRAIAGWGPRAARVGSQGTAGALQGAAAGAAEAGGTDQGFGADLGEGAGIGAGVGATLGTGANAVVNALRGNPVARVTAELADRAINRYGIDVRGSQVGGSRAARIADSALPGIPLSGMHARNEHQMEQFTSALARTMGEDATHLGPETMNRAANRIGREFDDAAARTGQIPYTPALQQGLADIRAHAAQVLTPAEMAPLERMVANVEQSFVGGGGSINGEAYQAMTNHGSPLMSNTRNANTNIRQYARQVRELVDNAMESAAPADVVQQLRAARQQYKSMLTLEDVVEKLPAGGQLEPQHLTPLLNQVRKYNPNFAYENTELGDLARIGQTFLSGSNHDTKEGKKLVKQIALGDIVGSGSLGAAGAWWKEPALIGAGIAGMGVPFALGNIATRRLSNPAYAERIINDTLAPRARGLGARPAIPLAIESTERSDRP